MSKNTNLRKITNYLTADNNTLSSNVSQTITGSLTVTGNLTAQQFIVSSSVTYLTESFASGSHKFGDSSDDIHTFTGSLVVSGSANPLRVGSNLLFVSSSGLVGINNVSPTVALDVTGAGKFSSSVSVNSTLSAYLGTISAGNVPASSGTTPVNPMLNLTNNRGIGMYFGGKYSGDYAQWIQVSDTGNLGVNYPLLLNPNGGNVGIGTSTPLDTYAGRTVLTINNNGAYGAFLNFGYNGTLYGSIEQGTAELKIANYQNIPTIFYTNSAERMRILANGYVGIGTSTPSSKLHVVINGTSFTPTNTGGIGGSTTQRVHIQDSEPGLFLSSDANAANNTRTGTQTYSFALQLATYGSSDWRSQIYFGSTPLSFIYSGDQGATTSERMRISTNGSIGAPNGTNIYNASDVRLKKNISTTTYGLDTITLLNPVKFNWIDGFEPTEDDKDMLGFVAQEVQTVIPEAIESFGGNSITIGDTVIDNPLRVNEKFIIPVLVKAIQELSDKNTALEEILQRNNIV